ncbi:MAG: hypothetical protein KC978_10380 [Candidatus Omnitrophica bacterium]|nr:hypothetical protein [Candidatus Omnitrophota bacterium]
MLNPRLARQTRRIAEASPLAILALVASAGVAYGQGSSEGVTVAMVESPNLFMALLIGFLLAVGFQLVLTQFSLAFGIANIGDLTEDSIVDDGDSHDWSLSRLCDKLGAWGLITASISLFAATYLALQLMTAATLATAAVMGLVIWAVFMVAMTILEAHAVNSVVGSLIATATSSLRSVYNATTGMFTKSRDRRLSDTASSITAAVRDEILGTSGVRGMRKELRNYFRGFKSNQWSPEKIKEDILGLLDDTEIEAVIEDSPEDRNGGAVVAKIRTHSHHGNGKRAEKLEKLNEAIYQIQHEAHSRKDLPSKVFDTAYQVAGKSEVEAHAAREQVEQYLLNTGKEELDPTAIKQDLGLLLKDPHEGYRNFKYRISHMDRNTVSSVLAQRSDLTDEEAETIVNGVVDAVSEVNDKSREEIEAARERVIQKVSDYLDNLDRPELSHEEIAEDIRHIFEDPRSTPDVMMARLRSFDRETLKAIIASRQDISEEDAENILNRLEEVRDQTIAKFEAMKVEIEKRIEESRQRMWELAEESRRTAAKAAWWTFATAVVSGIASVLGGILAAGVI